MMTPAIFNEATVIKTKDSDDIQAINIGLISEDKERFIQLFPGKALVGTRDQGYHQKTRETFTLNQTKTDSKFAFDLGDQISIHVSEPKVPSLDHRTQMEKEDFCVNMLYKGNCSLSRATNTVRCRSSEGIGMVVSHLPASDQCLYFDAEIITHSGDNVIGIGMTPTTQITDCIAHGLGHNVTKGCEAWASIHCHIGDVIGCGTWLDKGEQKIVFSHNDKVVCSHIIDEPSPLHAAILVGPGEAVRIMRSDIWNHPKTIKVESDSRMPAGQEVFESADGTVRICPKKTLLFERPMHGGKLPVSSIYIENNGQDHLLWKVRTNKQFKYISNPNKGIIKPGEISEIINECKSEFRDMTPDRFQIAYVALQSYEVASGNLDTERATELWDLKKSKGISENAHIVSCQWKIDHEQSEQKETNFAEELDDTSYDPVEPSFQVTVTKNGALVKSYWLPKGEYQLGIERKGIHGPPPDESLLQDVALHVPKLPSRGATRGMSKYMERMREIGEGTTYRGISCENVLFGVHTVQLRHHEDLEYMSSGTAYVFLPAKLTYDTLLHPSLQQLHDVANQKIYPVCQGVGTKIDSFQNIFGYGVGLNQDCHLMDLPGYTPEGSISYPLLYRCPSIMYNYNNIASTKVRLPSHSELVQDGQALFRHQVEFLFTSMLRTYALTAQLLTMPKYMGLSDVNKELGYFWEPHSVLPLDYAADTMCSTHSQTEMDMDMTGPYVELAEGCCFREDNDTMTSNKPCEVHSASAKDVQESLTKTPFLKFLMIEGNTPGPDVHISLPVLTEVITSRSQYNVFIDDCPKLTSWEGLITSDVTKQLELLTRCDKLEKLVINKNYIEQLPESIGQLKMLTTLHLEESHLTDLPSSFTSLKKLRDLRIKSSAGITEVMNSQYVSEELKKVLQDLSSTKDLTSDQQGKQVSALFSIGRRFGQNPDGVLGGFPKEILQLTQLRHLELSSQAIRAIPPQISRLENLESLVLDGCLQLEVLPSTLGFLPLKRLSLNSCYSLRTPSREIVERGTEAVRAYLKQMARGKKKNWRTKLMLVGIGSAGKTTLLRALRSSSHTAKATTEQEITHGIDITPWTASDEQNHPGKKVVFSAWDFAGQTVFYNTHQFFMSDRAVYLLVWSTRQGFENSRLEFWLSSIQCHSPDAPVFIVATHADRLTTDLPRGQLKKLYPQIRDFLYVGSTTGKGIPELKTAILHAALDQDYMGEEIPTVYLDLENKILSLRDKDNPYIKWSVVKEYAREAGIFDEKDMVRAVQFLQHIGSVQYFDYELLRDYVIIDPRWIVSALASIITFQDSVIKNGRLYHKHMAQLWKQYPVNIHDWLLRLTEMFDLTFQISKDLSLVPCLLSNEQPEQAKWPPRDNLENMSMMMIVYTFRYLPTGLFNRLQARLFEFSNGKTVWKKGSILEKKGQFAYLEHEENEKLVVQVLGQHPENILFLIHETLEDLINNSYRGVQFEYLIPCPDCVKVVGMDNPAMFEASMVREAATCSAPYIQCRRLFHTVPMNLAKALMPPDDNQELDLQLQRSMQSLGEMRNSLQTEVFVLFSPDDLLNETERKTKVDPFMVVQALRKKFTCFFDEKINEANTQSLMVSMQEAKTLLVFISNNFVRNERCSQLLQYAHSAFQDRLCLVNLSMDYAWKQETAGFMLSQKVFVNMKNYDEQNFKDQMNQIKKNLKDLLGTGSDKKKKEAEPVCFISYCWSNSKAANAIRRLVKKEATACDAREFKERIEKEIGVPCWLDIEQTGKKGLYEDITEGLRAAEVVVAFVSNEYLGSTNCMMELRFAISTLKVPTILVAVGTEMDWQYEEIGTLQRNAKAEVVDMRHEVIDANVKTVLDFVKSKILTPEQRAQKQKKMKSKTSKMSIVQLANISYTEEFELIQRKMMRRLTSLASHRSANPYPHIFALDFCGTDTKTSDKASSRQRPGSGRKSLERLSSALQRSTSVIDKNDVPADNKLGLDDTLCIRFLCEHDAGWHATKDALELHELTARQKESLLERMAPYMARMLTILGHSSVPLSCLKGDEGAAFKEHLVKLAHGTQSKDSFENSYLDMLQYVVEQDVDMTRGSLKECLLIGGRTRWLCPEHQKGYRVTVLTTDIAQRTSSYHEHPDYVKALMDGLREFKDKFPRETTNKQKVPPGPPERNICDILATARLGTLTPRTEGILNTGLMEFGTLLHTQELNLRQVTKEVGDKPQEVVPEDKKAAEVPKMPPSALKKSSRKKRPDSASSRPESASSSSRGEQERPRSSRKVCFKDTADKVGVEQKQAAHRKLKDMAVHEKVEAVVTSKACVLQ